MEQEVIAEFLARHGRERFALNALAADASARRYFRLTDGRGNATGELLMLSPRKDLEAFARVGAHLAGLGLSTPDIHAIDEATGIALIQDFGESRYSVLLDGGADAEELYVLAMDVLIHLHEHPDATTIALESYNAKPLLEMTLLLPDWYLPLICGRKLEASERDEFIRLWERLLSPEPRCDILCLRDYHVDNLMLLPGEGIARCGVLDFQDASFASCAYDVMSLVEDARRDVSPQLRELLLRRYIAARGSEFERDVFARDFALLSAQRHMRVLGLFCRLCLRDGKEWYAGYLPRVVRLLAETLSRQEFAEMRMFLDEIAPGWREGGGVLETASLKKALP